MGHVSCTCMLAHPSVHNCCRTLQLAHMSQCLVRPRLHHQCQQGSAYRLHLVAGEERGREQTCIAAHSKDVQPPKGELSRSCSFAPFSSRSSTMSRLPLQAAHCRGVSARLLGALGSAPAASKRLAACTATAPDLKCSGVSRVSAGNALGHCGCRELLSAINCMRHDIPESLRAAGPPHRNV